MLFKNTETKLQNSLFELKDKLLPINLDDSLSLDSIKNSYYNPEIDESKFNNGDERISQLSNDLNFNKDFSIDYDFESLINQVKERNISSSKICIDFCPSKKEKEIKYYFVDEDFEIKKDHVITTYYLKKKNILNLLIQRMLIFILKIESNFFLKIKMDFSLIIF